MKHSTRIGDHIQSGAAWTTFRLFQILPLSVGSAIGAGLGHLYALHGHVRGQRWFKRLQHNLAVLTGDNDPRRTSKRAYQVVRNSGRVMAEFPSIDPKYHVHRLNMIGTEHLEKLDGPVIIVSAHMANWEIAGASLVLNGRPITALYYPPANETVHRLAIESRERLLQGTPGCKLLAATNDAIKSVLRCAWKRENLLIFVDEEKDGLIWSPPLGRKLPDKGNRTLAALLALKCDYHVLPVYVRRRSGAWFDVVIEAPMDIQKTDDPDGDIKRLADAIAERTEQWVRGNPEQWYWLPDLNLDRPFPD